ncbi:PadR family transcriptional regulator [Clostridium sediminicola]|uniref:PadR family transcriptional regulator n=1 Tax=Clostridium sediminicola TaxID=3114879 RepID=UPI0031F1F1A4
MIDRAQLLKGLLEGCILKIIAQGETYGYQITSDLNNSGFYDLNEGSVYPVLIRLEKKGLVDTETKKSSLGPRRKYFKITLEGEKYLESFTEIWSEISHNVHNILKGGAINELSRK